MSDLPQKRVLIIDDEQEFTASLAKEFERENWEARTASSGADTRALIVGGFTPSLILLDIKMPGENGLDLLAPLRSRYPTACILILTGEDRNIDYVRRALRGEHAAYDYLVKPAKIPRIVARSIEEHRKWDQYLSAKHESERLRRLDFAVDCIRAQSHGLGSKLCALDGYLESVIASMGENEAASRARKLIKGMDRKLQRLDKYKNLATPIIEEFDLRSVITLALADAVSEFDFLHKMQRPELIRLVPDEPVIGRLDRDLLVEVVSNFLSNAFHACATAHDKGLPCHVEVSLTKKDGLGVFTVTDCGAGFPPGILEHIGERRLTGRPGAHGMGIGLMIARQVAGIHGGTFFAANRDPGPGAEVSFSILLNPSITNSTSVTP